jgi:hypothetical protein
MHHQSPIIARLFRPCSLVVETEGRSVTGMPPREVGMAILAESSDSARSVRIVRVVMWAVTIGAGFLQAVGSRFGTSRSVVQIHSPRPFYSRRITRVGASPPIPPLRWSLHCAQYCAHSAFQPLRERHPRRGEHSAWTSRRNCGRRSLPESKHRSQTRLGASETCASTSTARKRAPCLL